MALTHIPKPPLQAADPLRFSGSMYTTMDTCLPYWASQYIYRQTEDVEANGKTDSYFVAGHGLHAGVEYYLEDMKKAMKGAKSKKKFKSDFVARGLATYFAEIARLGGTEKINWPNNWGPLSGQIDAMLTAALGELGYGFKNKTDVGKIRRALDESWLTWLPENAGMDADGTLVFELGDDEKTPFDTIGATEASLLPLSGDEAAAEDGAKTKKSKAELAAVLITFDDLLDEEKKELLLAAWTLMWNALPWPAEWVGETRVKCSLGGLLAADRFANWIAAELADFPKAYAALGVTPVANELNMAPFDKNNPGQPSGLQVPGSVNLWLTGTADHIARDMVTGMLVMIDWKTSAVLDGYSVPGFAQRSMQLNHYVYMVESILADPKHPLHKHLLSLGFKKDEKFSGVQYVVFVKKPMAAGWDRSQLELPATWEIAPKLDEDEAAAAIALDSSIYAAPRETVTDAMRAAFVTRILQREADLRNAERPFEPSAAGAYNSPCGTCPVRHWCATGEEDKLVQIQYDIPPDNDDKDS